MKYSQIFLTLKGYSAISMFLDQPGICQFTLLNFHIIPGRCPWRLPGWKATPRSHPGKFWKIFIFPGESGSPHRGTETGCVTYCQCSQLSDLWLPFISTLAQYGYREGSPGSRNEQTNQNVSCYHWKVNS